MVRALDMDSMGQIDDLQQLLRDFADRRNWEQYHTPKNLALALAGEVGELCAEFQWLTPDEAANLMPEQRAAVGAELADVTIYLLRLADILGFDLDAEVRAKTTRNEDRFPAG